MSAATYNLSIDQGSNFAIQLTLTEDGNPKDITGYLARAQLRTTKTSSTVSATFECTVTDAVNGGVRMHLPNAVTAALPAGLYYYDLELYSSDEYIVTRLLEGQANVSQEVTR